MSGLRRNATAALFAMSILGVAPTVQAQQPLLPTMPVPHPGPVVEPSELGDSGNKGAVAPSESPRSFKLFDSRRSVVSYQIDVGPLWSRRVQDTTPTTDRTNFERGAPLASEIGFGTVHTTPSRPFFLVGHTKTLLRIIDDKSFSWALLHQELGAGLLLGPLEPEVRIRLSGLTADIIHAQPSIQLFTPGVSAGVGFRLGRIRLDIRGNVDYLWRWFGPDYMLRSITIGFRLDMLRQQKTDEPPVQPAE